MRSWRRGVRPDIDPSIELTPGMGGRGSGAAVSAGVASVLELQRLAGNRAVAAELAGAARGGRVVAVGQAVHLVPEPPPGGVRKIRELEGGRGVLGDTITSVDPSPPIMRPEAPTKGPDGWTARARPARVPELYFDEYYPKAGRHELAPHIYLDISPDWSDTIHAGEDEHVSDGQLAWSRTWRVVGDAIDDLAKEPGAPQPSEEQARQDLWDRFVALLPEPLRPTGAPGEDSQLEKWGMGHGSMFQRLLSASAARDSRSWHTPDSSLDHMEGRDEVHGLAKGSSRIGEVSSADLLDEIAAKPARR